MSSLDEHTSIQDMLNQIIDGKVSANRRYIDQVLQKIQDENLRYYLGKLVVEVQRMELEEKADNAKRAYPHKVMIDMYKDILEKTFTA